MNKFKMLLKAQMPFVMVMVAAIGIMFGVGCEKEKPKVTPQVTQLNPQQQQADTRLLSLENTSWKLAAFVEDDVSRTPEFWPQVNPTPFLLDLYQDSISGFACTNRINGSFSYDSENCAIRIYVGPMTFMNECDDGLSYIDRLNGSSAFAIEGDTLKVYVNEKNYLVFERRAL